MRRSRLIYIVFFLLPVLIIAQIDEFQQEFTKVSQQYFSQRIIKVTQHFLFSLGSADAVPFDSGYCYIEKNGSMMHYQFNGVESFSDGKYLVRISNPSKYMVVSRIIHADSSAPALIFSKGFSSFKNVEKKKSVVDFSQWKLTGGTLGVLTADITFDSRENRIRNIIAELSPDHPFVSQISQNSSGKRSEVFIRIDYAYSKEISKEQPQLSDFINVKNDLITPAEKFKDYQIKFIK